MSDEVNDAKPGLPEETKAKIKETWAKKKVDRLQREKRIKTDKEALKMNVILAKREKNHGIPVPGKAIKVPNAIESVSDVDKLQTAAVAKLMSQIAAAREDPAAFAEFVIRDPLGQPIILKEFQKDWLRNMASSEHLVIEASRGHGKTSLVIAFCLWAIGRDQNIRIKLFCQNDKRARERLAEIKSNIERNQTYHLVFPNVKPSTTGEWSGTRIIVERALDLKDATFEALGIETSATGGRCNLIVCDDVCTTPDTDVLTPDGFRKTGDIKIGDLVIGGDGKPHKVVATNSRNYSGLIYQPITGNTAGRGHCPVNFWGTAEHPIETTEGFKRLDCLVKNDVLTSDHLADNGSVAKLLQSFPFMDVYTPVAGHGGRWDYIQPPRLTSKAHLPEFWRLVGYYLSEGYAGKDGNISYTLSKVWDKALIEDVKHCVKTVFNRGVTTISRGPNCVQIVYSDRTMSRFLKLFGGYSYNKTIPSWVLNAPNNLLRETIYGIFRGDGSTPLGRTTRLKSTSHAMLLKVGIVLRRLGLPFSIGNGDKAGIKRAFEGKDSTCLQSWTLTTPGIPFGLLGSNIEVKEKKREVSWAKAYLVNDQRAYSRISEIRSKFYEGLVINFEVEDVHTYSHGMFTSHNCDLRSSIRYPSLRDQIIQKFTGEMLPILDPGGKIIYIATPWSNADLTAVLKANSEFKSLCYAIGNESDPFAPLWPERWPRDKLMKLRLQMGPVEFDRAYRCVAFSGDTIPCKPEWIKFYDAVTLGDPQKLICVQAYDLAIAQSADADYFAGVTVLYDQERNLAFVADAFHDRLSFSTQAQRIIDNYTRWNADRVVIERVGLGGGLENYLRENSPIPLPIVPYKPKGKKEQRFNESSPWLEGGRVLFHPGLDPKKNVLLNERGDLISEMLEFPIGKHDDMCLGAGTLIRSIHGYVPIEDIKVGDKVLTTKGRFKTVTSLIQREAATKALRVTGHEMLKITGNHPLDTHFRRYTADKNSCLVGTREFKALNDMQNPTDYAVTAPVNHVEMLQPIDLINYKSSSYKEEGDYLIPYITNFMGTFKNPKGKPIKRFIKVDKDLAWLFGLWIAEGSVGEHNVTLASHKKEIDIRETAKEIINNHELGKPCLFTSKNREGCLLSFGNVVWCNWLHEVAGTTKSKKIPVDWLSWPKELQLEFLIGYFVGDGYINPDGGLQSCSSSQQIAYGVREMLLRLDIPCVMRKDARVAETAGENPQWIINVSREFSAKITKEIQKRFPSKLFREPAERTDASKHNGRKIEDVYAYKIRKVEDGQTETVYNFSVEDDESYTANGLGVHNCDAFVSALWALEEFRLYDAEDGWTDGGGMRARMSVIG